MTNYIKNGIWERPALFTLLILAIILNGIAYLYYVSAIVLETANYNQNIQNLQTIQKEYQELEKTYFSLLTKLNLDYAYSLGFVSSGNSLSFLTKEIRMAQRAGENLTR